MALPISDSADLADPLTQMKVRQYYQNVIAPALTITKADMNEIEHATREQSNSTVWFNVRGNLLTASKFGQVYFRKPDTAPDCFIKELMRYGYPGSNEFMRYGLDKEERAGELYVLHEKKINQREVKVERPGFVVMPAHPWMGCTPDYIVRCCSNTLPEEWLIEIKSVYPRDNIDTFEELITDYKNFFLEMDHSGNLALRKDHPHYIQIIGQLNICNFESCRLVVYYKDQVRVIHIDNDVQFWQRKVFPKLRDFYLNVMLPELVTRRVKRGFKLYGNEAETVDHRSV